MRHDSVLWNMRFTYPAFQKQSDYKIKEVPYYPNGNFTDKEKIMKDQYHKYNSNFENLAENFTHIAPMADIEITKSFFFLRKRLQKLCQDKVNRISSIIT